MIHYSWNETVKVSKIRWIFCHAMHVHACLGSARGRILLTKPLALPAGPGSESRFSGTSSKVVRAEECPWEGVHSGSCLLGC